MSNHRKGFAALFFLLLSGLSALAIDVSQPAHLRMRLEDLAGNPVTNALVKAYANDLEGLPVAITNSDAGGWLEFVLKMPEQRPGNEPTWSVYLEVEKPGIWKRDLWATLIPGATVEKRLKLNPESTTRIKWRGPNGEPLSGTRFSVGFENAGSWEPLWLRTDSGGESTFRHPPLLKGFSVGIGRLFLESKDVPELTISLSAEQLKDVNPGRRLEVKLLGPDGQPAVEWFVGDDLIQTGAGGATSGGAGPWDTIYFFSVAGLSKIGGDGKFAIAGADSDLLIVSPEGMPLLYPLNQESWLEPVRHVTLTVPTMRRVHHGTLVLTNGVPLAGQRLDTYGSRSGSLRWHVSLAGKGLFQGKPLWEAADSEGRPLFNVATDEKGGFGFPIYYGSRERYTIRRQDRGPGVWICTPDDLSTGTRVTARFYGDAPSAPVDFKMITVRYLDEKGRAVTNIDRLTYTVGVGNEDRSNETHGIQRGELGMYLFVTNGIQRVVLRTEYSTAWDEMTNRFDVAGPGDKELVIRLSESQRHLPLDAIVLGPDGKPVDNVNLSFHSYDTRRFNGGSSPGPDGRQSYRFPLLATTGADGRFHLDAAPDECYLEMYRYNEESQPGLYDPKDKEVRWTLPGWTDPPVVKRDQRNLTVQLLAFQLAPGGKLRALVPDILQSQDIRFYLNLATNASRRDYLPLSPQPNQNAIVGESIPPGEYIIGCNIGLTSTNLTNVTVRADEETLVDLRARDFGPLVEGPPTWINVRLREQGRPSSGVVVTMFAHKETSDHQFPADLTDDSGAARFRVKSGARYTVVGRHAGRALGWKTITAQAGQTVEVELAECRTLSVTLDRTVAKEAEDKYNAVGIEFPGAEAGEAAALLQTLNLSSYPASHQETGVVRNDLPRNWVVEDLPVGRPVRTTLLNRQSVAASARMTFTTNDPPLIRKSLRPGEFPDLDVAVPKAERTEAWAYAQIERWKHWARKVDFPESPNVSVTDETRVPWSELHSHSAEPISRVTAGGVKFRPGALEALELFPLIEHLDLAYSSFKDVDLAPLGHLEHLRELSLSDTDIDGSGLSHLRGLKHLEILDLSRTDITDDSLAALSDLPNLKELRLASARRIHGEIFKHLESIKSLQLLDLTDTEVPSEAREEFQKRHPKLQIF